MPSQNWLHLLYSAWIVGMETLLGCCAAVMLLKGGGVTLDWAEAIAANGAGSSFVELLAVVSMFFIVLHGGKKN